MSRRVVIAYLCAAGTVAIWTGFILISRMGGKSALTPYDIFALRLGTASLILLPMSTGLSWEQWSDLRLWLLSMTGGLLYGLCAFVGFKTAPAAHGAILLPGLQPFLVAGIACWLNGTRPSVGQGLGLLAIGLGILCVAIPAWSDPQYGSWPHGEAWMVLASITWAAYSVLAKRWGYDPWLLTRFVALASALVFLPAYVLWLPKALTSVPTGMLILQGLYQGIGPTILAMLLFLKAIEVIGAERTGAMIALVPVLAGVAAVPLLDEPLTAWLLVGLCLVSTGAFLAARPRPSRT